MPGPAAPGSWLVTVWAVDGTGVDISAFYPAVDFTLYWVVAAIFRAGFLLIHRIVHSPFGQVTKAVRENEPRATSLGYRTDDYKLMAFVLSAPLAGVAGGTKALVFDIATLTDVNWPMSGDVVLMTLAGGFGAVVGAAVIVTMQNFLAEYGSWVTLIQGAIFVACVLAFRRGVLGEIGNWLKVKLSPRGAGQPGVSTGRINRAYQPGVSTGRINRACQPGGSCLGAAGPDRLKISVFKAS